MEPLTSRLTWPPFYVPVSSRLRARLTSSRSGRCTWRGASRVYALTTRFVLLSVRSFIAWTLDRLVDWSYSKYSFASLRHGPDFLRLYKFSLVSSRNQLDPDGDPSMRRSDLIFDLLVPKRLTRNMFGMKYTTRRTFERQDWTSLAADYRFLFGCT